MKEDKRFIDLYRLIDSGEYDLLSLDIFDTTVWRMVAAPIDVFFLLGKELRNNGWIRQSSSPESFAKERIQAEKRSRLKKKFCTEVTLSEIYAEFPKGYLCGIDNSSVADLELKKECQLVNVSPEMVELLVHAKEKGLKTAFVSDTYFNREQISELVGVDTDYTILSSEYHVSKYYGLHKVLMEQSKIPYSRILHVGDNYEADIKGPEIYPIDTYWFEKFPKPFETIIEMETPSVFSERSAILQTHDYGLTWSRSVATAKCQSAYEQWGGMVLGPLLTGFTDWVIDCCDKEGIQSVLCLMREGRILKKTIDQYQTNLDTTELFISRYTALKAAIFDGSFEELKSFVLRPSVTQAKTILSQLGISGDDIKYNDKRMLEYDDTLELIRLIGSNPAAKKKIIESSRNARKNLLKHLSQKIDLKKQQTVAMVDLGYKGTIQENLQKIFDREKIPVKTHGLYLVTGGNVYQTQSTNATVEGWLAENGQPLSMAHTFMRSPEVIEQSLMSDCGTTIGHDINGKPVLDEFYIPEKQRQQVKEIQKGLIRFANTWVRNKQSTNYKYTPELRRTYQNICIRSVARPVDIELELFSEWEHDENFGSVSSRKLTQANLDKWEFSHISPHQLASLKSSVIYWPFGLAHQMDRNMGEAVASIFLRKVNPENFDSCDEQPIIFYWDTGNGFNRKESKVDSFRLNNRSKIWKRFELGLINDSNRAIGISVGKVGEIINLPCIKMTLLPSEGKMTTTIIEQNGFDTAGYQVVGHNFYSVVDDPPLLVVPTKNIEKYTGTIRFDLFLSILSNVG